MKSLFFHFYGISAQIFSEESTLLKRLKMDFSYFHSPPPLTKKSDCTIHAIKTPPPWPSIPPLPTTSQSLSSLTYDSKKKRFNDYYGKALTVYNYESETGTIYTDSLDRLHELTYLMLLSRVGKKLDLKGFHKIHAFGVVKNQCAILGIMPMKGGKSTHFLEFLKDKQTQPLSDDTPLITRWGKIKPFP